MRYIILIVLNLPIIILAFINIFTQYKLGHVNRNHFRHQIMTWLIITIVLIGSFPTYNLIIGNSLFESEDLSAFDIIQTTAIVYLVYIINHQRQKIESTNKSFRDLHQELSIKLLKK